MVLEHHCPLRARLFHFGTVENNATCGCLMQTGDNNLSAAKQFGSNNVFEHVQTGNNLGFAVTQYGNSTVIVTQTGN